MTDDDDWLMIYDWWLMTYGYNGTMIADKRLLMMTDDWYDLMRRWLLIGDGWGLIGDWRLTMIHDDWWLTDSYECWLLINGWWILLYDNYGRVMRMIEWLVIEDDIVWWLSIDDWWTDVGCLIYDCSLANVDDCRLLFEDAFRLMVMYDDWWLVAADLWMMMIMYDCLALMMATADDDD